MVMVKVAFTQHITSLSPSGLGNWIIATLMERMTAKNAF